MARATRLVYSGHPLPANQTAIRVVHAPCATNTHEGALAARAGMGHMTSYAIESPSQRTSVYASIDHPRDLQTGQSPSRARLPRTYQIIRAPSQPPRPRRPSSRSNSGHPGRGSPWDPRARSRRSPRPPRRLREHRPCAPRTRARSTCRTQDQHPSKLRRCVSVSFRQTHRPSSLHTVPILGPELKSNTSSAPRKSHVSVPAARTYAPCASHARAAPHAPRWPPPSSSPSRAP